MKYLGLVLVIPLALFLTACGRGSEALPEDQQVSYDEVKELIEEDGGGKVKGSCNFPAEGRCLDYIGSMWTRQQMELNCQGAGVFATTTCPYAELGGCRTTGGTISETILWTYDAEAIDYQRMACNALAMCEWVYPEF